MFDIDESGAASVDWNQKVSGWDTTDPAMGGVGGADNVPLTQLALRTKNLKLMFDALASHNNNGSIDTLAEVYTFLGGISDNNITLQQVLQLFSTLVVAQIDGANITNPSQWLSKLGITHKVVRTGRQAINAFSSSSFATVVLPSALNYDPVKHTIHAQISFNAGQGVAPISVSLYGLPASAGLLTSFNLLLQTTVTGVWPSFINYSIVEKL